MPLLKTRPLALVSAAIVVACWLFVLPGETGDEPSEALALSAVMLLMFGFCPIFNLLKGLGNSPVARSGRAAVIASTPSFIAIGVLAGSHLGSSDKILGAWFLVQLLALPIAWALATSYLETRRPLPNNSFNRTPLRGAG